MQRRCTACTSWAVALHMRLSEVTPEGIAYASSELHCTCLWTLQRIDAILLPVVPGGLLGLTVG
jgi:hypothetical protein